MMNCVEMLQNWNSVRKYFLSRKIFKPITTINGLRKIVNNTFVSFEGEPVRLGVKESKGLDLNCLLQFEDVKEVGSNEERRYDPDSFYMYNRMINRWEARIPTNHLPWSSFQNRDHAFSLSNFPLNDFCNIAHPTKPRKKILVKRSSKVQINGFKYQYNYLLVEDLEDFAGVLHNLCDVYSEGSRKLRSFTELPNLTHEQRIRFTLQEDLGPDKVISILRFKEILPNTLWRIKIISGSGDKSFLYNQDSWLDFLKDKIEKETEIEVTFYSPNLKMSRIYLECFMQANFNLEIFYRHAKI